MGYIVTHKDVAKANQQFFISRDSAGRVQINALLRYETLWLTQKAIVRKSRIIIRQ